MNGITIKVKYLGSNKEIPVPIPKINWDTVTYINASYKRLTDLKWMKPCLNLQYLYLNHNNLSSLSSLPQELPNLQHLDISLNDLSSLSELPKELPNLQHLDISDNELSSLSGLPQELPNLQKLNISGNYLSSLSGLPQELPNLQHLGMSSNNLGSLSDLPEELPNLESLSMQHNKLSLLHGLPQELPNLQELDVRDNNLSSLSGLPQELPNLMDLSIDKNTRITILPNFLINYRNLEFFTYNELELELDPRMRRWLNQIGDGYIGGIYKVYENSQNVHDSSIQETVRQSMKKLLDQPNIPKQCLDTLRGQIVQDTILTPKSKDQLLEYIQSEEELHELCLTYSDLLWVVWHTLSGYNETTQVEIKKILNQELQDSDCKCFTGRMTRLVNCLNGFCNLVEVKILDSAQIGNIVLLIKRKLEQSDEGYSVEKHREEFREEMLSRGENIKVINQWLEYIE